MKNKKVILACIILLVISLVVIGVVLYTSPYNKALRKIKEINATTKIEEANVYTVDIYKLFNIYKGDLTSEIISKTYETFAINIIPRYYKACNGLDNNGINKYYKGNKLFPSIFFFINIKYPFNTCNIVIDNRNTK